MQEKSHFINDINGSVSSVLLAHFDHFMCCKNGPSCGYKNERLMVLSYSGTVLT